MLCRGEQEGRGGRALLYLPLWGVLACSLAHVNSAERSLALRSVGPGT